MIDAQVTSRGLEVVITGGDAWLFCMRPRREIVVPLEHILRAEAGPPAGIATRRHKSGDNIACAKFRAPTLVVHLDGDPANRMTLSVPDPEDTAAAIKGALRRLGR